MTFDKGLADATSFAHVSTSRRGADRREEVLITAPSRH
jgi:hypothetical protein